MWSGDARRFEHIGLNASGNEKREQVIDGNRDYAPVIGSEVFCPIHSSRNRLRQQD